MKFSIHGLLLAAGLLFATEAAAQRDDQFVWGIGAGASFPAGTADDSHKTGPHVNLMFGIGAVDSPFGIRFDGSFGKLNSRVNDDVAVHQGEASVFSLMGNGVFNLYGSNTRFYTIAGLGGYWYNPDGANTSTANDLVIGGGVGIWIPAIHGFIEARALNHYRALPESDTGEKGKRSALIIPVTVGILF